MIGRLAVRLLLLIVDHPVAILTSCAALVTAAVAAAAVAERNLVLDLDAGEAA